MIDDAFPGYIRVICPNCLWPQDIHQTIVEGLEAVECGGCGNNFRFVQERKEASGTAMEDAMKAFVLLVHFKGG